MVMDQVRSPGKGKAMAVSGTTTGLLLRLPTRFLPRSSTASAETAVCPVTMPAATAGCMHPSAPPLGNLTEITTLTLRTLKGNTEPLGDINMLSQPSVGDYCRDFVILVSILKQKLWLQQVAVIDRESLVAKDCLVGNWYSLGTHGTPHMNDLILYPGWVTFITNTIPILSGNLPGFLAWLANKVGFYFRVLTIRLP